MHNILDKDHLNLALEFILEDTKRREDFIWWLFVVKEEVIKTIADMFPQDMKMGDALALYYVHNVCPHGFSPWAEKRIRAIS